MNENKKFSDEELVEKIRSSDQELYAVIVERYQRKLLRYATNLIKDEHKAVDVVQESFIKAFINLNSFDTNKKFSSWIYRIVHNETMNSVKKYPKETPLLDDMDFQSDENIENDFGQKETIAHVEECLRGIPLLYSEPLTLHYIDEKSYAEVSDILRIPMGTVATRISRAKILMKHICQKN
jgi:RNA polymerase sigma-70 factor (ECF subfamily)